MTPRSFLVLLPPLLLLAGCGTPPPPRAVYMLGEPAGAAAAPRSDVGRPVLAVARVALPDYLDSTDLLKRIGPNQFSASTTGRWGERLSLVLTEDLAMSLARRLAGWRISLDSAGSPARRLVVAVSAVDIAPTGGCRLSAQWSLVAADGHSVLDSGQGSFTALAAAADDAAVVLALSQTIDQLAERLAGAVAVQ